MVRPVSQRSLSLSLQQSGSFHRKASQEGVLYTIHPARPPLAFQAAGWLLAGMFGMPALSVLLTPARQDGVSLLAAAGGLGVAGLAIGAVHRVRRDRRQRQFWLREQGLECQGKLLPWQPGARLAVTQSDAGPHARTANGIYGLAARIAAQQHAAATCLYVEGLDGAPVLLASGLHPTTARALWDAVARDWPGGLHQ